MITKAEQFKKAFEEGSEIVDVTPPSGLTYQFKKPSKFGLLFRMGALPQAAASGAVTAWTEAGVLKAAQEGDPEILKLAKIAFDVRDMVLELSYSPKLVVGEADASKDELSTDHVSDDDLAYFMAWVQAGGDASKLLATFPGGPGQDSLARANRKERRAKAKRSGGSS